jgi:hypothetical protein
LASERQLGVCSYPEGKVIQILVEGMPATQHQHTHNRKPSTTIICLDWRTTYRTAKATKKENKNAKTMVGWFFICHYFIGYLRDDMVLDK